MGRPAAPTGLATGIGSLPGEDIDAALALVFDALPELPHLPELPDRGPGADLLGRTATQLVDLPVDLQPAGWRLVPRGGLDRRRGRDMLERDLDALVPVAGPGYDGRLKLQLAGPWTLAAGLELPRGGRVLTDRGAVRDLAASVAATAAEHIAQARRRVPQAALVLQLDEPSLPAVLAGRIPTASGYGTVPSVEAADVRDRLTACAEAVGDVPVVVHCCAAGAPLRLLGSTGAAAVSVPLPVRHRLDEQAVGELVETGVALWLGVVPALGPGTPPSPREVADRVRRFWRDLGFAPELLNDAVAVTPDCGLAGASAGWVQSAYRLLRQTAVALADAPEGLAG